jgi:hypothetical protein
MRSFMLVMLIINLCVIGFNLYFAQEQQNQNNQIIAISKSINDLNKKINVMRSFYEYR